MLTKRIIPCLDVKDGKTVKGIHFQGLKEVGDPVEMADVYNRQGADELVFLDIAATQEGRKTMADMVEKVASRIAIPFTVGGGIGSLEDVHRMLWSGADKVSLNSAAVRNPNLLQEGACRYGSQCMVLALDARRRKDDTGWNVVIEGGTLDTGIDAIQWAKDAVAMGAGEILLTSMDADGTKKGYDLPLCQAVRKTVRVPIIASGGCGCLEDFGSLFKADAADAALAASLFHYGTLTVKQVKQYLQKEGIPVRL